MKVFSMIGDEVESGRAVAEVDVLDDAEVGESLQGPIDAGSMDGGVSSCHGCHDLLRGPVTWVLGQHRKHSLAGTGHPLAPGV